MLRKMRRSNVCTHAQLTSLLRTDAKAAGNDLGAIGQFVNLEKDYLRIKRARPATCFDITMRWMRVSSSKKVSGIPITMGQLPGMMLPTCNRTVGIERFGGCGFQGPDLVDCLGHGLGLNHKVHGGRKRKERPPVGVCRCQQKHGKRRGTK